MYVQMFMSSARQSTDITNILISPFSPLTLHFFPFSTWKTKCDEYTPLLGIGRLDWKILTKKNKFILYLHWGEIWYYLLNNINTNNTNGNYECIEGDMAL